MKKPNESPPFLTVSRFLKKINALFLLPSFSFSSWRPSFWASTFFLFFGAAFFFAFLAGFSPPVW